MSEVEGGEGWMRKVEEGGKEDKKEEGGGSGGGIARW